MVCFRQDRVPEGRRSQLIIIICYVALAYFLKQNYNNSLFNINVFNHPVTLHSNYCDKFPLEYYLTTHPYPGLQQSVLYGAYQSAACAVEHDLVYADVPVLAAETARAILSIQ